MFPSGVSLIIIGTLLVFTAATDPVCDPETQYLENGECCQKCRPGTRMESTDKCRDPVCKACDEGDYMDSYNTEAKCERQPYCDPNRNFKMSEHTSKTERATCLCKEGFHCSGEACISCIPHSFCEKGYGATTIGDQTRDTVCEKCPNGTFSDEVSWDRPCKKMTECSSGYEPQNGSPESDNTCVGKLRWHIGLVCAIVALLLGVAVFSFVRHYRNKRGYAKPEQEEEKCITPQPEASLEPSSILVTPQTPLDSTSTQPFSPMPLYTPEHSSGLPEENEEVVRTCNGYRLSQDEKDHIISQPETQAHDLISNNDELVVC